MFRFLFLMWGQIWLHTASGHGCNNLNSALEQQDCQIGKSLRSTVLLRYKLCEYLHFTTIQKRTTLPDYPVSFMILPRIYKATEEAQFLNVFFIVRALLWRWQGNKSVYYMWRKSTSSLLDQKCASFLENKSLLFKT
jgi:hypothetical protein